MPRFLIMHNVGYGETWEDVEAESQQEATDMAYQTWKEAAEMEAYYSAEPYTKRRAIEEGLEDEEE